MQKKNNMKKKTINHEVKCTCKHCGHQFDARQILSFSCPECGADNS